MSQITTHVLDTSLGKPAEGITIQLMTRQSGSWVCLAQGITDQDGRISNLLEAGQALNPDVYKMVFLVHDYFAAQQKASFYPLIEIQFNLSDGAHYHIPLLLNPFGYTTYRGS